MVDADWRDPIDVDWKDGGQIEVLLSDGSVQRGRLTFDVVFLGEEIPLPEVALENGATVRLSEAAGWRPL